MSTSTLLFLWLLASVVASIRFGHLLHEAAANTHPYRRTEASHQPKED
jgi:hypothetical protein